MVGMGLVTTSSPTSPRTGWPAPSNASTATPSARQEISPGHTGTVGAPVTSAATTSVPPEVDLSGTSGPNWSRTQPNECAGTGGPGRADLAQDRVRLRDHALALAGQQVARAGPDHGGPVPGRQPPQLPGFRVPGAAVVGDDAGRVEQ